MVRTGLLDKQLGYLAVYRDQRDSTFTTTPSGTMKRPDHQLCSSVYHTNPPLPLPQQQGSGTGARLGTAMAAAALQQHLSMSLGLSTRPRPARRRGPPPPNNRNNKTSEDREYVLEAAPPAPTLAQRYGLATPPPSQLTEQDWARVKETRSSQFGGATVSGNGTQNTEREIHLKIPFFALNITRKRYMFDWMITVTCLFLILIGAALSGQCSDHSSRPLRVQNGIERNKNGSGQCSDRGGGHVNVNVS
eukprot:sb/3468816/